jgi:hypothetical protein
MPKKPKLDSNSRRIEFHYEKGTYHRVIKIDGAWGGITPHSDIQMSIFSERLPFPELDEIEITDDKTLGKLTKQISRKKGVVREIEATLTMTPIVAKAVADWLLAKLAQLEALESDDDINKETNLVDKD